MDTKYKNPIFIFDFDNTLIIPKAKITILNKITNNTQLLTTQEYEKFEKENKDFLNSEISFSEFEENKEYEIINFMFSKLLKEYNLGFKTFILSARGSSSVPKHFKETNNLKNLEIVTLGVKAGENNGTAKANYIFDLLKNSIYDYAEFYDDREDCIRETLKLKKLLNIELRVFKVIENKFFVEMF